MLKPIFYCILILTIASCSQSEDSIDSDLRFAINTSDNSRGLSSYTMPNSANLRNIPQDPLNPLTSEKVELGKMLFHETAFSTSGNFTDLAQTYSCASCHHVAAGFQAGMMQGIGDGGIGFGVAGEGRKVDLMVEMSKIDVQPLRTPSAMNLAYQTNLLWNGQFGATGVNTGTESVWPSEGPISTNTLGYEGLEIQAIAGLGVHRMSYDREMIETVGYKEMFDQALASLPEERRYSAEGAGLAIAAYERVLLANEAPFQQWLRGNEMAMTEAQKEGAILFFTKGQCNNCHYGPGLAAMEFHAIGMKDFDERLVANFKPDDPANLGRASFTLNPDDNYKFKVPQLYNLKNSPFYGHGGSFGSVRDVIAYKNEAIPENSNVSRSLLSEYFVPLDLSEEEIDLLTEFVEKALYDADLDRFLPQNVMSNSCFPNNDFLSKADLGCD